MEYTHTRALRFVQATYANSKWQEPAVPLFSESHGQKVAMSLIEAAGVKRDRISRQLDAEQLKFQAAVTRQECATADR
jgi:hypothetical protein